MTGGGLLISNGSWFLLNGSNLLIMAWQVARYTQHCIGLRLALRWAMLIAFVPGDGDHRRSLITISLPPLLLLLLLLLFHPAGCE